ncbi:hypothetical protein GX51_00170 [Blastomyces parvus]|uniref:Uncharacterized protein n=1 Tax=Blastomyces parvus TaxID=2060905 RepID=A0A2B7XNS5_9EURO|nr:hypothetical protein GX51_00170 [Blastomyces parvus]
MSRFAFEPVQRPSSASTLIDPRGEDLTTDECEAVLGLLKLSGCNPQQMRTAEIELGLKYGYAVASRATTPHALTFNTGMPPLMSTPEDSQSSSDSTLEDPNAFFEEERFCTTPPPSPEAAPADINLGMRKMAIQSLLNTPPDSDSSGTGMKYHISDSPGNDKRGNGVRMAHSSPKIPASAPKSQNKTSRRKSVGLVTAQPVQQPTRRSTRQRKESRRLIEARESEMLGAR